MTTATTRTWDRVSATVLAMMILVLGGCTSSSASTVQVRIEPSTMLIDAPFASTVTGLRAAEQVSLTLATTAADGVVWSATADFVADPSGTVRSTQAPVGGAYRHADPMGLLDSLAPQSASSPSFTPSAPWTLTETVRSGGDDLAEATLTRIFPTEAGVRVSHLRPPQSDLYGDLFLPATTPASPMPAVVVFGGSEGGLSTTGAAGLLAAHGYPTLALAYFAEPGLPTSLDRIPLEYFAEAARFLTRQPGVDRHHIVMIGESRGSEAAMLTAADNPDLIAAVVAGSPAAGVAPGFPDSSRPAWTLHGRPLPNDLTSDTVATLPVERVAGPILLVCGGRDAIWPSCDHSTALADRLRSRHRPAPIVLSYPDAGHSVDGLTPYRPSVSTSVRTAGGTVDTGGTPAADQAALADVWPKVLAFVAAQRS